MLEIQTNRTSTFEVAGHRFSLTMPYACPLWEQLGQYAPFVTEENDNCVFSLELADDFPYDKGDVVYDAPVKDGETVVRLYSCGDGFIVEMSPDHRIPVCARLWTNSDFSRGRLKLLTESKHNTLFSVNNSLMLLYAFSTVGLMTLEMHSSVILREGKCYLFLGHSGAGKSTHSRQWLSAIPGSELLNDDNPVVRVFPDGRVIAYGSPWSGKTPCYKNKCGDVAAFVSITQAPHNAMSMLNIPETYAALYSSSSGLKNRIRMMDPLHCTLSSVISRISAWNLECLPDEDAARVCFKAINDAEKR